MTLTNLYYLISFTIKILTSVALTLNLKSLSVRHQMKAIAEYFPVMHLHVL